MPALVIVKPETVIRWHRAGFRLFWRWKSRAHHAEGIAAMDLFVVPTFSFRLRYGLVILNHGRRQILWLGVTAHPTAEWIARQLTEACGWDGTPEYIVRDRDAVYGEIFIRRFRAPALDINSRFDVRQILVDAPWRRPIALDSPGVSCSAREKSRPRNGLEEIFVRGTAEIGR